jgi:aspartate kinase
MYSLKFGGTSMGSSESIKNVAQIILNHPTEKKSVVVSAMSGTTNLLLEAGEQAKDGNIDEAKKILAEIKKNHLQTLQELVNKKDLQKFSETFISSRIFELSEFLEAIAIIREISARSHDEIVSLGEILSAHLLTMHLRDIGVDTEFVSLESIVPETITTTGKEFFEEVKVQFFERIKHLLSRNAIPICTGFFGKIPGGIVGAVGRGYSDFTAALMGYAYEAEEIQIWTDVSGILSADPRICPDAIVIPELSFQEASELANFGAKVIHPQTIWPAVKHNIPVRIKNTMCPDDPGTVITKNGKISKFPFKSITAKKEVVLITLDQFETGSGVMAKIFQILAENEISVDLISTSEASISFTIEKGEERIKNSQKKLEEFCRVHIEKKAILSIVGEEMGESSGTAGKIFSALGNANISIKMISQSANEINISMIINEKDINKGIEAVHDAFF